MRRKIPYLLLALCFILTKGCTQSCDDREVSFSLRNETGDTIYYEMHLADAQAYPSSTFNALPPNRTISQIQYMNDIKSYGVGVWLLQKHTYRNYPLVIIDNEGLYDAVLTYSWEELSAKQFRIIIRNL